MPLKYDKDGMPSFVPDFGEEIEEGKTPKPVKLTNKTDPFKGDKPLTAEEFEALVDGELGKEIAKASTGIADKMLAEALGKRGKRKVKAGDLDAHIATDGEVDEIEKLANARQIKQWPLLRRLINRLRRAEAK